MTVSAKRQAPLKVGSGYRRAHLSCRSLSGHDQEGFRRGGGARVPGAAPRGNPARDGRVDEAPGRVARLERVALTGLPPARVPLDEIDHPLQRKAEEQFAAEDTPHERIRAIDDVVLFKVKEAYVTTAEMLRAEGRAEALVQVLTVKFGSLPESVSQRVHGASSDQIQAWTARAVTAETLDQVFG